MSLVAGVPTALTVAMMLDSITECPHEYRHDSAPRGWVARELKKHFRNIHVTNGVYRTAVVFDDHVIKWSRDLSRQEALKDEARFIRKMRKTKFARHFPRTRLVTLGEVVVMIQERVPNVDNSRFAFLIDAVIDLGAKLGIDDVHGGNFGWRGRKGKEYPVFIDVDIRHNSDYITTSPRTRRSWEV